MECPTLEKLYDWCLKRHYSLNDHHPEHFNDPKKEMSDIARMELTCDLLASVLGVCRKKNIPVSISECRFSIEKENWNNWEYAIKDCLPVPSNTAPCRGQRWIHFPEEEKNKLNDLFEKYKSGVCHQVIKDELLKLDSVKYYLEDLKHHKSAIEYVWEQIPEFEISGMKDRIQKHDNDKYDTLMILGYTAHWCFPKK